ncbi:MBL fold metallo-hydrolase [Streptomyces sp. QTS137]
MRRIPPTRGRVDHVGGAHVLWERAGRRAQVVIHEADAPMLRSRRAHVDGRPARRGRYPGDPAGEARVTAAANAVISGETEPTLLVRGGEGISLGGGVHPSRLVPPFTTVTEADAAGQGPARGHEADRRSSP